MGLGANLCYLMISQLAVLQGEGISNGAGMKFFNITIAHTKLLYKNYKVGFSWSNFLLQHQNEDSQVFVLASEPSNQ